MIEFILMLAGAMFWTAIVCAVVAFAVYKLMGLEDRE